MAIVTHARRDFLKRCLDSIRRQAGIRLVDAWVVVNPSGDGTEAMLSQEYAWVKTVRMHRNIGFFPALNIAIANCAGEYVMTVDDDSYFLSDDALARMSRVLDESPEVEIVTCTIDGPREIPRLGYDALVAGYKTGFTMIRRGTLERVGYYPDIFFRSGGENYVAMDVWDSGGRIVKLADTLMHHDQTTVGRSMWLWNLHGARSQALVIAMRDPILVLPIHLFSNFARGIVATIRKEARLSAFLVGWMSALTHLGDGLKRRKPIRFATFLAMTCAKRLPLPYVGQGRRAIGSDSCADGLRICVVITTRNRRDAVRQAIDSCLAQDYGRLTIRVYDDASDDGTLEMAQKDYPEVHIEHQAERKGYIFLRNMGLRESEADYVLFLDDDAYFSARTCVSEMVAVLREWPECRAAALRYVEPLPVGREVRSARLTHGGLLRSFVGTAHVLHRVYSLELGGYLESLVHQGEEKDLAARMFEHGAYVRYIHMSPIVHRVDPRRDSVRVHRYGTRNLVLFDWFFVPAILVPFTILRHVAKAMVHRFSFRRAFSTLLYAGWALLSFRELRRFRRPMSLAMYCQYLSLQQHGPEYGEAETLPQPCRPGTGRRADS